MKNEKEQHEKPLSIREKMTIYLIIALIQVIKPMGWKHELDSAIEELKALIKT